MKSLGEPVQLVNVSGYEAPLDLPDRSAVQAGLFAKRLLGQVPLMADR